MAPSNNILNEFISQLRNDAILGALANENDVINYILSKGKNASIAQREIDKAIKEFYMPKREISNAAESIKEDIDSELSQKKLEHIAAMNKVESEISKYVNYNTESRYERNIEFLINNRNKIKLDEDLIIAYIAGYCQHVKNTNTKRSLEKYLDLSPNKFTDISRFPSSPATSAISYDRYAARTYAHTYCGTVLDKVDSTGYNTSSYPVYSSISNPNRDCVNFGSQCLQVGGKKETGSNYSSANAWFCNTTSSTQLALCSLSWRYSPSFKAYWKKRCSLYTEIKEKDVYEYNDFIEKIYSQMYYGDIIHLADSGGAPYHTLIVTSYYVNGQADIGYSCHSANQKDKSLFQHTRNTNNMLLLYHFE